MTSRLPKGRVFISTGAFQTGSLREIISICEKEGLRELELSSGVEYYPEASEDIRKWRARGFSFLVHNYFPPPAEAFVLNLASNDDATRQRSIDHCKMAIKLCSELGAPFYSVHSGFALNPAAGSLGKPLARIPRFPIAVAKGLFVNSLRQLCDYADQYGVSLLIENNVLSPMNLTDGKNEMLLAVTAPELLDVLRQINSPRLKILVDVGHLKISAGTLGFDREEFLNATCQFIRAWHLSDNDGVYDTNQPFGSDAWFLPWLRKTPETDVILESYKLNPAVIKKTISIIEEFL